MASPAGDLEKTQLTSKAEEGDTTSASAANIVPGILPEGVNLSLSLNTIPAELSSVFQRLATPIPKPRNFFKDYLPILTPLAAVVISGVAFYYTNQFNKRASVDASSKTLADLISFFEQRVGENNTEELQNRVTTTDTKEDARNQNIQRVTAATARQQKERVIAAMKIAAYGDQALLAVKMALGSDDPELREGGKLVAEEMYLVETVEPSKLTKELLSYYDNSVLRLGVQEWLERMEGRLSPQDSELALDKVKLIFGSVAEHCTSQDESLAQKVASFLPNGHLREVRDFMLGMVKNCIVPNQLTRFEAVRNNAMNTLGTVAGCLLPAELDTLLVEIGSLKARVSDTVFTDTLARIEAARNTRAFC